MENDQFFNTLVEGSPSELSARIAIIDYSTPCHYALNIVLKKVIMLMGLFHFFSEDHGLCSLVRGNFLC